MNKISNNEAYIFIAAMLLLLFMTAGISSQEIEIYYEENAQIELFLASGTRILIDVYNPEHLALPAGNSDILLTSHLHDDHYRKIFSEGFPGKKLQAQEGKIKTDDEEIFSIVGAHDTSLPPSIVGTNYVFVIDIGNMRIVHFGDQDPESITSEQYKILGKVDIAIMQFGAETKYCEMIEKLKPLIIIPTHLGPGAPKYASQKWKCYWVEKTNLVLRKSNLPKETTFLFMGMFAKGYGKLFKLEQWNTDE